MHEGLDFNNDWKMQAKMPVVSVRNWSNLTKLVGNVGIAKQIGFQAKSKRRRMHPIYNEARPAQIR